MNKRNSQGLLEENADLRLQLHQQREEINQLQNRLQVELRTNNVLNALRVPHHKCALYSDDHVSRGDRQHQHQQLLQLEAKFRSELQDAKVRAMDLLRMLQQKDMEMSRMKTEVEAVIRRHKVIVKELLQRENEWKRRYTALEFSVRAEQRDRAYSASHQEVSSTGEEEEAEEAEDDVNMEGEEQVVGLSQQLGRCLSLHQQPPLYVS